MADIRRLQLENESLAEELAQCQVSFKKHKLGKNSTVLVIDLITFIVTMFFVHFTYNRFYIRFSCMLLMFCYQM